MHGCTSWYIILLAGRLIPLLIRDRIDGVDVIYRENIVHACLSG